jgi:ABC-type multidrug transport system fused ATPase/permease subunit
VRIPAGMTPSQINVTSGAAFSMTLDRTKAQALLDEAGRSDLVLPASVDGAEISVDIPASVSVAFGTCPRPGSGVSGNTEQSTTERRYPDCVILAQIPSPSVNAPANLDIEALARIGLEFTGMSPEEAAELTSTVNWTSTLLVPIPRNAAIHEQVSVDGVTGTLIQRPSGETHNSPCCGSKMGSSMPSADWARIPSRQWKWQTLSHRSCMSVAAIETQELRKVFGDNTAVKGLTLQVAQGEVFGFLGPNGAGKTTSMKMLLGLVAPTSGKASCWALRSATAQRLPASGFCRSTSASRIG